LAATPDATTTSVRMHCDGQTAHLRLDATRGPIDKMVDLSAVPLVARSRYVALAIAEVVSVADAESAEPPVPPAPIAPPVIPPPASPPPAPPIAAFAPAPPIEPPRPAPDSWTLSGLADVRSTLGARLTTWGGGARLSRLFSEHGEWAVDARGDRGDKSTSLGAVDVTTASAGLTVGLRDRERALSLRAAVGARVGIGVLAGAPSDAVATRSGSFVAGWAGPCLDLGVEATPASWLVVGLAGEGGVDVIPASGRVNGAGAVELAGAWIGGRLSLGVLF